MTISEFESGTASSRREVLHGVRDAVPLYLAASPFGVVFGAAAVAAGYSISDAVFASASVFGGASQFVFIQVNGLGVPAWSVILAVFAVNFRHILYSAATGRRIAHFSILQKIAAFFLLTDLQFAACEVRAGARGDRPITAAYYFGLGLPLYACWIFATFAGAYFGGFIKHPEQFGLDFILPIYFLAILMGFRKRRNFLPVALVSAGVSFIVYQTLGAPWHISIGALAGVAAAALMPVRRHFSEVAQDE